MYLVIETYSRTMRHEFTHFIELTKNKVEEEVYETINHIKKWDEVIKKVYFSKEKLSNW